MFALQILAFVVFILILAKVFKEDFLTVLPIGTCILILFLYVLAFFRVLSFSDYAAIALLIGTAIFMFRQTKQQRKEICKFAVGELRKPESLTIMILLIAVGILVSAKITTWWDDYNFWAVDAKSLYYLNGFADKYMNVAPEFGDYPPGIQLFKWWFLHFSPNELKEGLMFSGYYAMNIIFLAPILKQVKKKNVLTMTAGAILLWIFPAVAEVFWCDGTCADLTMAVIYGAFLTSVVERKGHSRLFYYGRQALLLSILIICKNTGFIWILFGLILSCGYQIISQEKKDISKEEKKANCRAFLGVILLPVLTEGSWLSYCLLNRRVAKLTGTAVHMVTRDIGIPEYQSKLVAAFKEAFIWYPLHRWKTVAIDLSPLTLYVLLLLAVLILFLMHKLTKKEAIYFSSFLALSGIVFYTFNLICHLTIFASETQYLEPYGMVSSIERYGAPFTIGGMYLILYFVMKNTRTDRGFVICLLFVMLTTDWNSSYRALYGYRNTQIESIQERNEIVDEAAEKFLTEIGAGQKGNKKRVLYLRDIDDVSWVRNTYIGFEAAPVSVMYGNIDTEYMGTDQIVKAVTDAHAGYLYADKIQAAGDVLNALTEDEFQYNLLYQVIETDTGIRLIPCIQ